MRMMRRGGVALVVVMLVLVGALGAQAQGLAEYDYENLSFRGVAVETGYIFPTRVDPTWTLGLRVDMGYLGPNLRIIPGVTWWSSQLQRGEVEKLENQIVSFIRRELDPVTEVPPVNLGTISWSDVALRLDGQWVWPTSVGLLGYVGTGGTAHILSGSGEAIEGTFVADLLNTVRAGVNLHAGLELPPHPRFRVFTEGRLELLEDLRYAEVRLGGQIMMGGGTTVR